MHEQPAKGGFTLIELSIVLVIIGLIIGGVLVGQDLIRAAQLRAVWSDVEKVETAINVFRLKYNCIPGDCPNATTFWGEDAGCPTTIANTVAKQATCNGTGDRAIAALGNAEDLHEIHRLWQHMGNAELIKGKYSGTPQVTTSDCGTPVNCFYSEMDAIFRIIRLDLPSGSVTTFAMPLGHYMRIGAKEGGASFGVGPVFTPLEAANLDEKFDNGKPGLGKIIANPTSYAPFPLSWPDCSSSDDPNTAEYRKDIDEEQCQIFYKFNNGYF